MKKIILVLAIVHIAIVSFLSEATTASGRDGLRASSASSSSISRRNMHLSVKDFNHSGLPKYASLEVSREKNVMQQRSAGHHKIQSEYK